MPLLSKRRATLGLRIASLGLLLSAPTLLRAQDDHEEAPALSDSVGDGLAKLEPLIKVKDWDGAMKLVDGLLQSATPDSYDQAFLNETEAQILTQKGDYPAAITPLENAITIADRHHYYQPKQETVLLYFLSQLYDQKAEGLKNDKEAQGGAYAKAIEYIQRWFEITPKPTEDVSFYYASLLYSAAIARDPTHPDPDLIKKSRIQIEKTLHMSVHPKDNIYMFLLATLQQQNDYKTATEVLELMLSRNPNSKAYWQDLNMFYMALAQDPKDKNPDEIRKYNIRAINTIERAQALGYMKTPRDNYTLFTLYYNIGQYGLASDLLYNGLENGTIDSTMDNWLLLSGSYQQINEDFKAIEVLEEAAKRFPTNGELEFKIGQVYQQLDNNEKAYEHYTQAIEKGHLVKAQPVYVYLAYTAYESNHLDEAKAAVEKAIQLMAKPDHQAIGLRGAIDEALKEREAKKASTPDKL